MSKMPPFNKVLTRVERGGNHEVTLSCGHTKVIRPQTKARSAYCLKCPEVER